MENLDKRLTIAMASNWWVVLLHGILGILFGIMLFAMPGFSILVLVYMFAFILIFDGAISGYMGFAIKNKNEQWWVLLAGGILGILLGVITLFYPNITAITLLVMLAIWTIIVGVANVLVAIKLRKEIDGEIFMILSGMLSILVGVLLIARPLAGMVALVWIAGFFAVFYGTLLVLVSFKLKKLKN